MPLAFNPSPISSGSGVIPWKLQASDYGAKPGERILVDTSAGSWALTLPEQVKPGEEIDLFGVAGLEVNPLEINLGQTKFENQVLASLKLIKNDCVKLVFGGATIGWMASNKYNLEINLFVAKQELLLDKYPGANLALALRKISNSYQGNAIRINSGASDIDITFNAQNELNTSINTANALIWYDQSGKNLHANRASATRQPILSKINNKYVNSFDSNAAFVIPPFDTSLLVTSLLETSIFLVWQQTQIQPSVVLDNNTSPGTIGIYPWDDGKTYFQIENNRSQSIAIPFNTFATKNISAFLRSKDNFIFNQNGADKFSTPISAGTFTAQSLPLAIGASLQPQTYFLKGFISELIIYPEFKTNYREIIAELNQYHQVY